MDESHELSKGDWLMHLVYGPGQISAVEEKTIAGESKVYYRVEGDEQVYWVDCEEPVNERVRPIASPERIEKALGVLDETPEKMNSNYKVRRKRIRDTTLDGVLRSDVEVIRDLAARKKEKGLNVSEADALKRLKDRFLLEWSLSIGCEIEEARTQFNAMLDESIAKAKSN